MQRKNSLEVLQILKQQRVLLAISVFTVITVLLLINNYQLLPTGNETGRVAQLLGIALAMFVGVIAYFNITQSKRKQAQLIDTQQQTHAILKSVGNGLFLINPDLKISKEYSKQLETILGQHNLAEQDLLQILSQLVLEPELLVIQGFFKQLFDGKVNEKLIQELNPLSQIDVRIHSAQGKRTHRCLNFQFTRIYEHKHIVSALVNVSDITRSMQQQQQTVFRSDLQANLLLAIMHADQEAVLQFNKQAKLQLEAIHEILTQESGSTKSQKLKIEPLTQHIHQLRHSANQLNLQMLVYLSDEFEQHISDLKQQNYLNRDDFLPLDITLDQMVHVLQTITQVHARLQQTEVAATTAPAALSIASPETDMQRWQHDAQQVAKRHHKSIHLICTHASFQNLPLHLVEKVQDLTWNLISNAVVHGIESPEVRESMAKTEHGQVTVSLLDMGTEYRLSVEDDGKGIDYEAIQAQAVDLGWCQNNADAPINKTQLLHYLFQSDFSTLAQMNSDAGDGMGLYWVQTWVDEMGGHLDVVTQAHQFTRFIITLPKASHSPAALVSDEEEARFKQAADANDEEHYIV